jgi:YD repeat-containing protein
MKISVVFIIALVLAASCSTSEKAVDGSGAWTEAVGGGKAPGGQIPVEVKTSVMFADGSLDEYVISDYDPLYAKLLNQNRYSASGALLEQVEYSYQEDSGHLAGKLTRDMENRLKTRVLYDYDSQGRLIRETLVNKSGKTVSSYEYGYDNKGNRISRVVNSGAGIKLAETSYTFNAAGLVTASETKDGSGKRINFAENQYDAGGNLISQKVYNAGGEVTSTINAVWKDGLEVESDQIGSDGTTQIRILNEYGPERELIRKKIENLQGQSTQIFQYEYTFKPNRHTS